MISGNIQRWGENNRRKREKELGGEERRWMERKRAITAIEQAQEVEERCGRCGNERLGAKRDV